MTQTPSSGSFLQKWQGDILTVTLDLGSPRRGRAALRTNLGAAAVRRREIIQETERGITPLAEAWSDAPMMETSPGVWTCAIRLEEVGIFSCKACFFPDGSSTPEWPEGSNFHVKVAPARTRRNNSIYTVFPRQFGPAIESDPRTTEISSAENLLDFKGYTVIPPGGTFRDVIKHLDTIIDEMHFKIVQLLPIFPVPTTYARMGRFGCPFAATDFLSVDPACAEFDEKATPLDQFCEFVDAVHAKSALVFIDLPANHTGWASTLQIHHPEWFNHLADGSFKSPGAWGVVWADLVELDYTNAELRTYMADVFLFWCRHGVDGFRCDAGYMIPEETWTYIVARVREEYPSTVFMLEGLGGKISVTDALLNRAGLDWAYSEIFQTYTRDQFQWYLPGALDRGEKFGALVHFAETHDNDRLAAKGKTYSRLRVGLAALLSQQGAWGMANGVEWYATEKIDVHGAASLNWGAKENQIALIAKLNSLLASHPLFGPHVTQRLAVTGPGNTLAVVRKSEISGEKLLVVANLDCSSSSPVQWDSSLFPLPGDGTLYDLVTDRPVEVKRNSVWLEPGEFLCLAESRRQALAKLSPVAKPAAKILRRFEGRWEDERVASSASIAWTWPEDARRDVVVPGGIPLKISAPYSFRADVRCGEKTVASIVRTRKEPATLHLPAYAGDGAASDRYTLAMIVFTPEGRVKTKSCVVVPPPAEKAVAKLTFTGSEIRNAGDLRTVLSNGTGADAFVPVSWGKVMSQYDSLFSANPNPNVPDNRLVLWTRCRVWLQHDGYSRELNENCLSRFRADPAGRFAMWFFRVPCGMGRETAFAFRLSLDKGVNAARLTIRRFSAGAREEMASVRLVFRPDIEWRSFHDTTKAAGAVENAFRNAIKPLPESLSCEGFDFAPYRDGHLTFTIAGGTWHEAPEWTYMVPHPDEAERGQNDCGDLFSPGWISCDFAPGYGAEIRAAWSKDAPAKMPTPPVPPAAGECAALESRMACLDIPEAAKQAMNAFVQKRDNLKTVLAGYPWFLDWGRDTFIFLRGFIAAGHHQEALAILTAFASFEENGTIPNIIYGDTAGNRDTVDAPLWLFLAAQDLADAIGHERVLQTDCRGKTMLQRLVSIARNYISGTPNGIKMNPDSALVWSPAHFTWMDTNYPAGTPRTGYAVEIQALWIRALEFIAPFAPGEFESIARRARESLVKYFTIVKTPPSANTLGGIWTSRVGTIRYLADALRASSAAVHPASAEKEDVLRPNQLFATALGVINDRRLVRDILSAAQQLLVPGGIRSAADQKVDCNMAVYDKGRLLNDPHHPYFGRYTGDEDTSRKIAYHNGTVWAWPFPVFAESAFLSGMWTKEESLSLLASSVDNLNSGCIAHISEIADGDAPHAQKGCRAQAWSVSELYRVWRRIELGHV